MIVLARTGIVQLTCFWVCSNLPEGIFIWKPQTTAGLAMKAYRVMAAFMSVGTVAELRTQNRSLIATDHYMSECRQNLKFWQFCLNSIAYECHTPLLQSVLAVKAHGLVFAPIHISIDTPTLLFACRSDMGYMVSVTTHHIALISQFFFEFFCR